MHIALAAVALSLAASSSKPGLLVLEPEVKGASAVESLVVNNAIAGGARDLEAFDVMTSTDLKTMLGLERQKQLMGAGGESASYAEALGARHTVASSVTKSGPALEVDLRLIDTATNKVLAQKKSSRLEKPAEVSPAIQGLTQELLGVLLANEQGSVLVRASEEGSEVRVDGKLVASTPMTGAIAVPRGRHRIEVGKNGFITQFKPTEIRHNETTVEDIRLVPSPDYIDAYLAKAKRMRMGAWISLGAAVAFALGAVIVDRAATEPAYSQEFLPRAKALSAPADVMANETSRATLAATLGFVDDPKSQNDAYDVFVGCPSDLAACHAAATEKKNTVQVLQGVTIGLAAAAVLTGALSAYFFIAGEDPTKYTRFSFMPLPSGGGAFALSGEF